MSGPGDPGWEKRRAVIHGEKSKAGEDTEEGAGTSTAETGESASFQGDGPAGESVTGGVEIAAGNEADDKDSDRKR